MGRRQTETYIVLTPKNTEAKKKLEYHGERWVLRKEVDIVKFSREPGPWLVLMSRDGKKLMHVKKANDPDFDTRVI